MQKKNETKERIFLCRKIKRNKENKELIFEIKKIIKIKYEIDHQETTNNIKKENKEKKREKIISIDEILIPSFLNDFQVIENGKFKQRLRKYSEVSTQFNDSEEAEVYLIKKENLFLNDNNDDIC